MGFLKEVIQAVQGKGPLARFKPLPDVATEADIARAIAMLAEPRGRLFAEPWLQRRIAAARRLLEELYSQYSLPDEPFNWSSKGIRQMVVELLSIAGSPMITRELNKRWKDQTQRAVVARCAGGLAHRSVLPIIHNALLSDDGEDGRPVCWVILSLNRALHRRGRLPRSICAEAIRHLPGIIRKAHGTEVRDAISLYLRLDRAGAERFLNSRRFLRSEYDGLGELLRVLRAKGIRTAVSPFRLFRAVLDKPGDYRTLSTLGQLAVTAATMHLPEAESLAMQFKPLASREHSYFLGIEALEIINGINPAAVIWNTDRPRQWRELTRPQQLYAAVSALTGETCNGGITQYLSNSSGDHWPDALAGLQAMRLKKVENAFRAELARFGPDGPSAQRRTRNAQLDRLSYGDEFPDTRGKRSRSASDVIIKDANRIYDAMLAYALANRQHFASTRPHRVFGVF